MDTACNFVFVNIAIQPIRSIKRDGTEPGPVVFVRSCKLDCRYHRNVSFVYMRLKALMLCRISKSSVHRQLSDVRVTENSVYLYLASWILSINDPS